MNLSIKRWSAGLAALLLALSLAACGSKEQSAPQEPAKQEQEASQQQTQADSLKTTYPLTLQDATGESFTFNEAPKKIVSVS